jgi:hypothetical protein
MTKQEANRLLDRVKDGADINFRLIREALEATGDKVPYQRPELALHVDVELLLGED